jgi:hypothetical protein
LIAKINCPETRARKKKIYIYDTAVLVCMLFSEIENDTLNQAEVNEHKNQ